MDTNNRKGNGIFLGIVSVATLIVAIIGATFAYFSASTQSEENALNLGAYEFKLNLTVEPVFPNGATSLIPLSARTKLKDDAGNFVMRTEDGNLSTTASESEALTYLEYALNFAEKKCVDDNEMQVCALYRVTINNQAANAVTLTGQIKTTNNMPGEGENKTQFLNLTYQALSGNHEAFDLALVGDAVPLSTEIGGFADIADIEVPAATINEDTGEVIEPGIGTAYILIYLNENGDQSSEMGATFTGQIVYTSGAGTGNTLTGTFTVKGPEEDPDAEQE